MPAVFEADNPVAGTLIKLQVPADTAWVQIHNDTAFKLYCWFGDPGFTPTATSSPQGQYHAVADPGEHPVIPLQRPAATPRERSLNAVGAFQGTIQIMPVALKQAFAGTPSAISEVKVALYAPYETPPQSFAVPRYADVSSQQRVIAVPITMLQKFLLRSAGPIVTGTLDKRSMGSLTPGMLLAQAFNTYLYWADFQLTNIAANSIASVQLSVQAYPGDGSLNPIAGFTPIDFYFVELHGSNNNVAPFIHQGERHVFAPQFPWNIGTAWASGSPVNACYRIQVIGVSGTCGLVYNLAADLDSTNATDFPGDIGNKSLYQLGASASNADLF